MLTSTEMLRLLAYKRRYVNEALGFPPGTMERLRFLAWLVRHGLVTS